MTQEKVKRSGEAARLLEAKVGIFVLLALIAGATAVFMLGQKKHVFEKRVRLYAIFDNVQGLSEGAPVRLSGVTVGKVRHVGFDRNATKTTVRVDLEISETALDLIRQDSLATIGAQGLLGDKVIELAVGSTSAAAMEHGGRIESAEPADLSRLMAQASKILDRIQTVAEQVVAVLSSIADPNAVAHIRGIIASVHGLLRSAETGQGLAHSLFYDKNTAHEFTDLVAKLDRLATNVDTGVTRLDRVLAATDGDGDQLINNVSRAAKNVGAAAGDLHDSKIFPHLERASSDVAVLTQQMRAGQGTVGALLVDPTVYEQLVTILGGIARSKTLRTLVRYVVHQEDDPGPRRIDVLPPPPAAAPPKR